MKFSRIYRFVRRDDQVSRSASAIANGVGGFDADAAVDAPGEVLFDKLRSVFLTHGRRQFGVFETDAEFVAATVLRRYGAGDAGAEAAADALADEFEAGLLVDDAAGQETDVFLWVVIDDSQQGDVVYLFLLAHEQSHFIDDKLAVANGHSLFTNRLQYAARIHLQDWLEHNTNSYLSLLAPRNNHAQTLAWSNLLRFSVGIDRAATTVTLLENVDAFAEAMPEEKARKVRERVSDFCMEQSKQGKPVALRELSAHVDADNPALMEDFLRERMADAAQEIYPDRAQLRRYTRFFGRDNDLSIGFSTALLGQHVEYDDKSDTLIIRALPKSLKNQLRQYLKQSD